MDIRILQTIVQNLPYHLLLLKWITLGKWTGKIKNRSNWDIIDAFGIQQFLWKLPFDKETCTCQFIITNGSDNNANKYLPGISLEYNFDLY